MRNLIKNPRSRKLKSEEMLKLKSPIGKKINSPKNRKYSKEKQEKIVHELKTVGSQSPGQKFVDKAKKMSSFCGQKDIRDFFNGPEK